MIDSFSPLPARPDGAHVAAAVRVARIVGLATLLVSMVATEARGQPHRPRPAPRRGVFDTAPSISADGKVLVWFHRAGWTTRIVVARAPFETPPRSIQLRIHAHAGLRPVISANGRHIFWSAAGKVRHVTLGAVGRAQAVSTLPGIQAGPFDLRVNGDGTKLAMLVDGPPSKTRTPGWRAVSTAALVKGQWKQGAFLTSTRAGGEAWNLVMNRRGDRLVYTDKGRLFEASSSGTAGSQTAGIRWKKQAITGWGLRVSLLACSADGKTLLLLGRPRASKSRPSHIYLARRAKAWRRPELVVRDKNAAIYSPSLSPDGSVIVWSHYIRPSPGGNPSKTQIRTLGGKRGVWKKPAVMLEVPRFTQMMGTALSQNGRIAYALTKADLSVQLFYRGSARKAARARRLSVE